MKKKDQKKIKNERDLKKEKVMLRKGVITLDEIRRLWHEKESV